MLAEKTFELLDTDEVIILTKEAREVISECQTRLYAVADEYGRHSDEHIEMKESFLHALLGAFRLGGRIGRDGQLALFGYPSGSAGSLTFGMIFHPKYNKVDGEFVRDELLGTWSVHT